MISAPIKHNKPIVAFAIDSDQSVSVAGQALLTDQSSPTQKVNVTLTGNYNYFYARKPDGGGGFEDELDVSGGTSSRHIRHECHQVSEASLTLQSEEYVVPSSTS